MRQTVTGLFETLDAARHAQEALLQRGFALNDIELPVHEAGVLAGIERLVSSFFSTTGDARANAGAVPEPVPHAPGAADAAGTPAGNVLIGVRVSDEARADLARETLREEHALEVAIRGGSWAWAAASDTDPVTREHSALDELGIAGLADAMRRRVAPEGSADQPVSAEAQAGAVDPARPASEAEATVLTAASAPGAGAVMGTQASVPPATHAPHVDVPSAPQATETASGAQRIPDEFIEYEEDSHDHRASDAPDRPVTGSRPTLH
ncbi:hypothetical protein [Paraburkholderia tropica]|uniref:hypothetical protein n=1 Tax=Paraburkholderia tropica TaxID=92647 RepID=UPI0007ECAEF4|nr:hypothetical protein [Paraburkholderia tropica]MBB2978591.1 hypothetical protein [Paraburkholderia tropica]MBB2998785.1 hypothetical protein [Paraburkholderia tropica]MBB6318440.1 hypothetical protein [Paraburkholderia tropica]OBR49712.1 hypothetical protein A6456_28025 [Paraburkholderia tropica]